MRSVLSYSYSSYSFTICFPGTHWNLAFTLFWDTLQHHRSGQEKFRTRWWCLTKGQEVTKIIRKHLGTSLLLLLEADVLFNCYISVIEAKSMICCHVLRHINMSYRSRQVLILSEERKGFVYIVIYVRLEMQSLSLLCLVSERDFIYRLWVRW